LALTEISLSQEEGFICQIFTRTHIITADDPVDPAADDEGPTPLEYLLSALGSSAAISLKMAAIRMGIEVEEVQVSVQWRTSHARRLDPGEMLPAHPIQREIRIRVSRDISEFERDALLEAARMSPVSRVLGAAPKLEDALYVLGYADPDPGTPS
jgi:putative redox protein